MPPKSTRTLGGCVTTFLTVRMKFLQYRISAMPTRPWPSKDRGHRRFSRRCFLYLGSSAESHREFGDEPARVNPRCPPGGLVHSLRPPAIPAKLGFEVLIPAGSDAVLGFLRRLRSQAVWTGARDTLRSKCAIRSMVQTSPVATRLWKRDSALSWTLKNTSPVATLSFAKEERHRQKARRHPCSREIASDSSALRDLCERRKLERRPAGRFHLRLAAESLLAICRSHLPRLGRIWKLRFGTRSIEPVSSRILQAKVMNVPDERSLLKRTNGFALTETSAPWALRITLG